MLSFIRQLLLTIKMKASRDMSGEMLHIFDQFYKTITTGNIQPAE